MSARPRHIAVWSIAAALILTVAAPPLFAQGGGRVTGSVVDEDGNPIAGAQIVAENPTANPSRFEETSGDDGRFSILGFVSGQWTFTATVEGYQTSTGGARITQGRNAPIDFILARALHPLEIALGVATLEGLDPEAIQTEFEAADAIFNEEDWDGAIAAYSALLEKLPVLTNLHLQIGHSYRSKGEYDAAIAAYERLKMADPNNSDADMEIARVKMMMGDFEAASEELAAAASGLNASREDLYNLGELEFAKGNVDTAAEWYEKAAMVSPDWGPPLFKLALVALNKGEMETAKEFFQKVVDLAPDTEEGAQAAATLAALP